MVTVKAVDGCPCSVTAYQRPPRYSAPLVPSAGLHSRGLGGQVQRRLEVLQRLPGGHLAALLAALDGMLDRAVPGACGAAGGQGMQRLAGEQSKALSIGGKQGACTLHRSRRPIHHDSGRPFWLFHQAGSRSRGRSARSRRACRPAPRPST